MAISALSSRHAAWLAAWILVAPSAFAQPPDPAKLLGEADRLAWMKAWSKAEPLFADANRLFEARGDHLNALHAKVGHLRAQLPRLAVPDVSRQLGDLLDDPLVQGDDRLRLRVLVAKGETDEDLDPTLAQQSWQEAKSIAERLGDAATANRARGELGIVAALLGDVGASIMQVGAALKGAQATGDTPSVVRWLTLSGRGFAEMGRPAEALGFYDRALAAAATVEELSLPVMTYLGKGEALARLDRLTEAEATLKKGLDAATTLGSLAYQAELSLKLAVLAGQRKSPEDARRWLADARAFAKRAGTNRVSAQVALEGGRLLREQGRLGEAAALLHDAIAVARGMQERMALPRLLAELADVRASEQRFADAAGLLEEGSDLLEGLLAKASSPWVQARIVNGARDLFLARIRLEGLRGPDAARLFAIIEQARGRALLGLLRARPVSTVARPAALKKQEREIAELQRRLFQPMSPAQRRSLLDQITAAEEALAPLTTELFDRTRRPASSGPVSLAEFRRMLKANELFLAYALSEPRSYVIVVTPKASRVHALAPRTTIRTNVQELLDAIRSGKDTTAASRRLRESVLGGIGELASGTEVMISPDAELHQVPFEVLTGPSGSMLLATHAVSYASSASVLAMVRASGRRTMTRPALAVSASPSEPGLPPSSASVSRSIFDLDGAQLRPLPSANDEARAVAALLGANVTLLIGDSATEQAVKQQPLGEYCVLHFAVHGVTSTKFPARSALLLHPAGAEDGLLQAREVLGLRLRADLVTLSACDTGSGSLHEQEGVTSLVRPFMAAGARAVVANLWAAEDRFSLTMMREFYRQLSRGVPVGEALRQAKLRMLEMFGPEAVPRLWSGVLAYGDASVRVVDTRPQQEDAR
jgi:CHAT domain-containing protein